MPFTTTSPPAIADWQLSLNGLTLGNNTAFTIQSIDGLGMPDVANGDVQRPLVDGQWIGLDLLPGRDITVTLSVSTDGTSLQSALLSLAAALPPSGTTEIPLWWKEPNLPIMSTLVRVRKRPRTVDIPYSTGSMASIAFMVHATDPVMYGQSLATDVQSSSTSAGGTGFPIAFPLGFGAGGSSIGTLITNDGNRVVYPVFTIEGPSTNPTVSTSDGGVLGFTITVESGQALVIDTDTHSVVLTGAGTPVNRRSSLNAGWSWFGLPPGDTTLQFTGGGTLRVSWAPGYII